MAPANPAQPLTDKEFWEKLVSVDDKQKSDFRMFMLEPMNVVANGRTQLSHDGVALIVQNGDEQRFIGFFGDYNPETGELTNVCLVMSDDLLAVKRACLIIGA